MKSIAESECADPVLYRLYWTLMLNDILTHLGYEHSAVNKKTLHEFHKRMLGFDTISGKSQETVSRFLKGVEILWAEQGIFVRNSGRQPFGIENMDFNDVKHLL